MRLGTQITFSNGKSGVLLGVQGSVHTFGKIDKKGDEIHERAHFQNAKRKVFAIRKGSLKQLIKVGDIQL